MRELITSLLKLQGLEITLQESRIVFGDDVTPQMRSVEEQIRALRRSLPDTEIRRFDRLKRSGIPVVKERRGVCSGCHLNIPRGDLNRMARDDLEWVCPNCGRFLLLSTTYSDSRLA